MTEQALDPQRVFYLFHGRPTLGLRNAPGRPLIAEFGSPSLEFHGSGGRRLVRHVGLYQLELKACDWEIVVASGSLSSSDPAAQGCREIFLDLEGQYFKAVTEVERNGDAFTLLFDLGGALHVSASADSAAVQWSMTSVREVQRIRNGGRLSIEQRDMSPDQWARVPTIGREESIDLQFQSALLGAVGPQLRAITVINDETSIHFNCYFDGEISDEDRESMSIVDTEILAGYPETHEITRALHRLDRPATIPGNGRFVYFRREEDS